MLGCSVSTSAFAWIYPAHRHSAVLALQGLDAEREALLDRFWQQARAGAEQRLYARGADAEQGLAPPCIDWAALPGIAGDHSCSRQQTLDTVSKEDWILVVADVAAQLKSDLARIPVTAPPDQSQGFSALLADPGSWPRCRPACTAEPAASRRTGRRTGRSARRCSR